MRVIIIGCGRMGRGLARLLDKKGDEVIVVDQNKDSFKDLGSHFSGKTILGFGIDKEVLELAGIERADALVTCTSNDEVNALVARAARIEYQVPQVIARLYDPHKASIYNALGIQVLSSTLWGIRHTAELLSYNQFDIIEELGNGNIKIVRIEIPPMMVGRNIFGLRSVGQCEVTGLRRGNKTFIPSDGMTFESGDALFLSVQSDYIPRLKSILGMN